MKKNNVFASLIGLAFMGTSFGLTSCADDRNDLTNTKANTAENQETLTSVANKDVADYTFIMYAAGGGDLDYSIMCELYDNYAGFGKKVNMAGIYKSSRYVQKALKGTDMDGVHYFEMNLKANVDSATVKQHLKKEEQAWDAASLITDKKVKEAAQDKVSEELYKDFCSDFVGEKYDDVNMDMGNPNVIAKVIKDVAKKNPAKKYILVTNNHGGGWRVIDDRPISRAQVFDDNVKDDMNEDRAMSLDALNAGVQQSGITFDAIFCDLCVMAYIENLTGFQQNFKFCIASAESTTYSYIGKLGTRLAAAGANISDDALLSQLTEWVKNDEYKNSWESYAKFDVKYIDTQCQDMGVYDLRKIGNLTNVMKDIATWYTTAYDNATYKRIINKAVLTSNYISAPIRDGRKAFYNTRNEFLSAIGYTSDQIADLYASNSNDQDLYNKYKNLPKRLKDFADKGMLNGITYSHFVYTTLQLMKTNGIDNADVAKLNKLYNSYQSTLKNMSYIKCAYSDFPGMDPYLWTSPTITLHSLNPACFDTKNMLWVAACTKFSPAQAMASYNNTKFDQETGWSKFLRKLTVTPSVMTNPLRSDVLLNAYYKNK